jgi:hypothetical protein
MKWPRFELDPGALIVWAVAVFVGCLALAGSVLVMRYALR